MEYKGLKTYKLIDKEGYFDACYDNKRLFLAHAVGDCITGVTDKDGDLMSEDLREVFISNYQGEFRFFKEVVYDPQPLESEEGFITRCVKDNNGKWPLSDYDRHVHWDKVLGWNNREGRSVYYVDFDKKVLELAKQTDSTEDKYWDGVSELEVGMVVGVNNAFGTKFEVSMVGKNNQFVLQEYCSKDLHILDKSDIRSLVPDPKEIFCKEVLEEIRSKSVDFAHDTTWDIKEVAAICWDKLGGSVDE